MNFESFPRPDLRRRLAELGVPPERHAMKALLELLPAALQGRPYDETSADAVAEVLIYLAERDVLSLGADERDVAWGSHVCRFYGATRELVEIVAPYFGQGLRGNERCIWVAPDDVAAGAGLADGVEVFDPLDWYLDARGELRPTEAVLAAWQREEARALAEGYSGLRISGDASFLRPEDRAAFAGYEARVHDAIGGMRLKALCTYPLHGHVPEGDVLPHHHGRY
jgi:hypothetical protein